jgi:hypothetical protein
MDKYGKGIPFFEPYTKFVWYPASRCIFVLNGDYPIARDCFNLKQAREAARDYLIVNAPSNQEGDQDG